MNEYEQALTMILKLEDTVAELLEALEDVLGDAEQWYHSEMEGTKNYDPNTYAKCHELIRNAKGD